MSKLRTWTIFAGVGLVLGVSLQAPGQNTPIDGIKVPVLDDPIGYSAYGKLFDQTGKEIKPTTEFLRRNQIAFIERLMQAADGKTREASKQMEQQLNQEADIDDLTKQSLLTEWLIETVAPPDKAFLYAKNRTMRIAWYKALFGEQKFWDSADKASGLPLKIADFAKKKGMLRKVTMATGADYIKECEAAGVPTPPTWGEEGPSLWNYVNDLTTNFVGSGSPAKIYRYDSKTPDGICVALPRISGSTISLLGVICLGRQTGNVCFYDNAGVAVGQKVPMDQFLSGGNLTDVCSDCHAGENPFVVHPGQAPDLGSAIRSPRWHTPIVRADWPHNPGPNLSLSQVPVNGLPPVSDATCTTCHEPNNAGRFPDIPALNFNAQSRGKSISGYCGTVLLQAMGATMPGGPPYHKHVNAMRAFCKQSLPPGAEVAIPEVKSDPNTVSPPIVMGPLYACVDTVEVRGAIRNAKLVVQVNGVDKPAVQVTTPSHTLVRTGALVAGDVVRAYQDYQGVVSDPSRDEKVIDHTIAYPTGLPEPRIDPTLIHECGRTIAVRHVRGATVSVLTNGANPATYNTGSDWTNLPPAIRPFVLGHEYQARQQICTDISKDSRPERAVAPPAPMPTPILDPATPIAGQELVTLRNLAHGALTSVFSPGGGLLAELSTAENWRPEVDVATRLGRPLQPGDRLTVTSELCTGTKISTPEVTECQSLPTPIVAPPLVGSRQLIVLDSTPGAHIFVFDSALRQIGAGSGNLIGLTRAIVQGDVLTVTQRLGTCQSRMAYRVSAVCASVEDCKL